MLEAPIPGKEIFALVQREREGVLVLIRPCIKASPDFSVLSVLPFKGFIQGIHKTDLVDTNTGVRFEVMKAFNI